MSDCTDRVWCMHDRDVWLMRGYLDGAVFVTHRGERFGPDNWFLTRTVADAAWKAAHVTARRIEAREARERTPQGASPSTHTDR